MYFKKVYYIIWFLSISSVMGMPLLPAKDGPSSLSDQVDLFKFFRDFGYLPTPPSDTETLYTEEAVSNALRKVQKFGGIEETGKFDNATRNLLVAPRCGNPDLVDGEEVHSERRKKRYIIGSKGWDKRLLSYNLNNWSRKFPDKSYVENSLQKAFQAWSHYSGLIFKQVDDYTKADIQISFGRYDHGDRYPFDGPGYTLAHAYYPYTFGSLGGDIHFDEDENWGADFQKLDIFTVAIHEIGHALGLSHSTDRDSVMFAYYKGDTPALGYDDILAVYNLYIQNGPPHTTVTTTDIDTTTIQVVDRSRSITTTANPTASTTLSSTTEDSHRDFDGSENPINEICNGKFDSISVIRGEIFIFKGMNVWRYRSPGDLVNGFPVPYSRMFTGIPPEIKKIDAAYEKLDGTIVFFSGERYYEYDGRNWTNVEDNNLSHLGLPNDLKSIDSVFVWNKDKKTYIFEGDRYWKLNSDNTVEDPKSISESWSGLPSFISSIITWENGMYAFKDGSYWLFDDEKGEIQSGYPLQESSHWLPHCRNS